MTEIVSERPEIDKAHASTGNNKTKTRRPAPDWAKAESYITAEPKPKHPLAELRARYRPLTLQELDALPDPEWLIDGVLEARSLAELYGKKKCTKTFLSLAWGLCIASGHDWLRKPVQQGPVIYVAGEGAGGLKWRIREWREAHGLEDAELPFYVIKCGVDIPDPLHVEVLAEQVRGYTNEPTLIVLDTKARCFGRGDENNTKDMNAFVKGCDELRLELPTACVLVLAHEGKDARRGSRGNSAMGGAVDTEMNLFRRETKQPKGPPKKTDQLMLYCVSQRNAAEFEPIPLRFKEVGQSAIIVPREWNEKDEDESEPNAKAPKVLKSDTLALRALGELTGEFSKTKPEGVTYSEWRVASGLKHSTFGDAVKRLDNRGMVEKIEATGHWRLTRENRDSATPATPGTPNIPETDPTRCGQTTPGTPPGRTPFRGSGASGVSPEVPELRNTSC